MTVIMCRSDHTSPTNILPHHHWRPPCNNSRDAAHSPGTSRWKWYTRHSDQLRYGYFTPHGPDAHNHYCWPTIVQQGKGIGLDKFQVWKCHLSHGRTPDLLQFPQKHWPTHGECKTGWPMDRDRCIRSQYYSDHAGWQGLLPCCQRTPTYIRSSGNSSGQYSSHSSSPLWQSKLQDVVNLYKHDWNPAGLHQSWERWQLDSTPRSIHCDAFLAHNILPHKLCTVGACLTCRHETLREDCIRGLCRVSCWKPCSEEDQMAV